MMLASGTKLGRYEIRSKIGEGGMGEVYRAHDPKLRRDVAVKVLPPLLSTDEERLRRFEQEAQTLASLNHPNILSIIDFDAHDGAPYVVSELLEGETLREKLNGVPLPQRPAIDYALQIARGLAAAHDKGIVHRDLKPENIFITKDGHLKILDFGLAKLLAPEATSAVEQEAPTRRVNTEAGTIMGTVGYMSPEQLRGQTVGHRSDIFSFGTVLYEMLAGQRAFHKDSVADTVSATLKEEPPDPSAANTTISPAIEGVVRHCLAKNPEQRFQSARDLAFALEALSGISAGSSSTSIAPIAGRAFSRERLAWIAAGVMFLALLAALPFIVSYFRRAPVETSVVRFPVLLPEKTWFDSDVERHDVSISPDGRRIAFIATSEGQRKLYVRALDQLDTQALAGTEAAYSPFWSPDCRYIAFFAEGKLKKIEAAGGPVQTICDVPHEDVVGSWGRDGTILFMYYQKDFEGLYRVGSAGGAPAPALKADKVKPVWVSFLPDGQHFLFYGESKQKEIEGIYVGTVGSQETKLITLTPLTRVEYAPPGYLVYAREGALLAQSFDASSLRLAGEPLVVVERMPYFDKTGWAEFSVSQTGVLLHATNSGTARLAWFDRTGREVGQLGATDLFGTLRLSADLKKLAVTISDPRSGSGDIWIYDLDRDTRSRFAFGPLDESDPVWSPDELRLAYFANGKSTLRIKDVNDATGSGQSPLESGFISPQDWSADGRFIIYTLSEPTAQSDLWVLPLTGDRKPFPFTQTEFNEAGARFSPDGRFVAYVSNESGADEVYVKRFGGAGEKWRVSTAGGSGPRWRRDGKELFYVAADGKVMAVQIKGGETFDAGPPAPLFALNIVSDYDVAADGQRFLVGTSVASAQTMPFTVVLNWTAGLRQKQ